MAGRRRASSVGAPLKHPPPPRPRLDCRVEGLAFGGEGVARVDGMVVFVEGALPGERAAVEIAREEKRFKRGRAVEILKFSPDRVPPRCRLFGRCGGCVLQHLRYESQVAWKRRQALDILARIGGFTGFECGEAVPSPSPYAYRNSVRLHRLPGREPRYGFCGRDARTLVEVARCEIAADAINGVLPEIGRRAGRRPSPDEIWVRAGAGGGVVVHPGAVPAGPVVFSLAGASFSVPPASFFQVNVPVAEAIAARLADWIGAEAPGGTLFDLHCGAGIFSVLLGNRFRRTVGIDRDARAVAAARGNAAEAGAGEAVFTAGDAGGIFAGVFEEHAGEGSVALLDPPRGGVDERLIGLLAGADRKLARILYVSCNPATLARDLKRLCAGGAWRLEKAAVFDMFPQTAHLEVCAAVRRA